MSAAASSDVVPAVILLSGGLDSTTVLAIAAARGHTCHALTVDYGQRHNAELNAATQIAAHYGATHRVISVGLDVLGGSALTDHQIEVPAASDSTPGEIPSTYVPARNTVMLSIALATAEVVGARDIFIGVNAIDYSGYPDCRPEFINAFQNAAQLATKAGVEGESVEIHSPLIHLNKAEIIKLGIELGVDYSMTVTCYAADEEGRACGRCEACAFRAEGFRNAGVEDATRYQSAGS